ncbi:acetoin utilization AcuB family protein [Cytobacillus sp. Hm23]
MIVEQIMKTDVTTLFPNDTIETAIITLHKKDIRHIPIVDKNHHIIGVISDRDLRDASPSILELNNDNKHILKQPIKNIMKTDVITGHPLDFVEEVAAVFYEHRIGCMPLTNNNKLVGIVTETDVLHTLVQLTGAHQPSSHIEIKASNKTGMLSDIASIFKDRNININSVLVYPDVDESYKILVFRVQTMNPLKIVNELKNEGYTVLWPTEPGVSL